MPIFFKEKCCFVKKNEQKHINEIEHIVLYKSILNYVFFRERMRMGEINAVFDKLKGTDKWINNQTNKSYYATDYDVFVLLFWLG